MDKKIKIEKIVIAIGKKELVLTLEEAKELKAALGELFGKEYTYSPVFVSYVNTYPKIPSYPYYTTSTGGDWITVYASDTVSCKAIGDCV